ncbi:unnamed protein product [Bemisia tabaci]|uniref:Uncharacterized protein n=1 Tax=Bemisia tabaci TaxID=7038 RepID=A0A9P0AKW7_BEMTA|nr:PREDICTED: EKC/KEOPS complex subunit LAGE3 isoform X2 [Bemisia tabaci]CAH0393492.1 unnamed protein product [Bemisia tabaci]
MEPYSISISCPVQTERESEIISSVLDTENMDLPNGDLKKEIAIKDKSVCVTFSTKDIKLLRNSANMIMDHIPLIKETISRFGPPLDVDNSAQ